MVGELQSSGFLGPLRFQFPAQEAAETEKETDKRDSHHRPVEESALIRDLQSRDREIRSHEAAHLSAAGGLASSGPSYTLQRGPDGRLYATGGEVSIDTSKGTNARETIAKAKQIRAAALAPAAPSTQDFKVATAASKMENEAFRELQRENREATAEAEESDAKPADREASVNHSLNAAHVKNWPSCLDRFFQGNNDSYRRGPDS